MPFRIAYGTLGNDSLVGEDVRDPFLLFDELIFGFSGADTIEGRGGNDWIWSGEDNDAVYGGEGNDVLINTAGSDYLWGGNGDDVAIGAASVDVLYGQAGNDSLWGADGADYIYGGAGADVIVGDHGVLAYDDWLYGEAGDDVLIGGGGGDKVYGGDEADWLFGLDGSDTLDGGYGVDIVVGGEGADHIYGGRDGWTASRDVLIGGPGPDIYYAAGYAPAGALNLGQNVDIVWGFSIAEGDKLLFSPEDYSVLVTATYTTNFANTGLAGTVVRGYGAGGDGFFLAGVSTTINDLNLASALIIL